MMLLQELLLIEKKWSGDVKTKKHSPAELFASGTASAIADWLKSEHDDLKGAMAALNFYVNRAGKNLSAERRKVLDDVKHKVRGMYSKMAN